MANPQNNKNSISHPPHRSNNWTKEVHVGRHPSTFSKQFRWFAVQLVFARYWHPLQYRKPNRSYKFIVWIGRTFCCLPLGFRFKRIDRLATQRCCWWCLRVGIGEDEGCWFSVDTVVQKPMAGFNRAYCNSCCCSAAPCVLRQEERLFPYPMHCTYFEYELDGKIGLRFKILGFWSPRVQTSVLRETVMRFWRNSSKSNAKKNKTVFSRLFIALHQTEIGSKLFRSKLIIS